MNCCGIALAAERQSQHKSLRTELQPTWRVELLRWSLHSYELYQHQDLQEKLLIRTWLHLHWHRLRWSRVVLLPERHRRPWLRLHALLRRRTDIGRLESLFVHWLFLFEMFRFRT